MPRDSSVGIATRYGLDGPGIKSRRGLKHPPPSTAKVKERVELYLYSHSGPLCPVLGRDILEMHDISEMVPTYVIGCLFVIQL